MVVDVRGDANGFDLRIGEQFVIILVMPLDTETPGQFAPALVVARTQGAEFDARNRSQDFGVLFAEEAQADHAADNCTHGEQSPV